MSMINNPITEPIIIPPAESGDRYQRQSQILPAERMAQMRVIVIGCGAVGSQVARQLAHIGQPNVTLCDFDTVGVENLCCQGFHERDLGMSKVEAVSELMGMINSERIPARLNARFRRSDASNYDVIFCCVDKIETRKMIWEACSKTCQAFFDVRIKGGDSIRVISATKQESRAHYPTTLFAAEEAQEGECTAKMTIYGAYVAAGILLSQYGLFLRRFPITGYDVMLNLCTMELGDLT